MNAPNAHVPPTEKAQIRRVSASSLSRRLNDAGFGVQVMAYHEGNRAVPGRAFVGHHGHDQEAIRAWLTERGLVVTDFGAGTFDVSLPPEARADDGGAR